MNNYNTEMDNMEKLEQIQNDIYRLQDAVDDYKTGEKVDLRNLTSEFQNILKFVKNMSLEDLENLAQNSSRKSKAIENVKESLEYLKQDFSHIQRNTDAGRANKIRDRLRKKLEDKKLKNAESSKQTKMKGPDLSSL